MSVAMVAVGMWRLAASGALPHWHTSAQRMAAR
jgi:hypothetical protein